MVKQIKEFDEFYPEDVKYLDQAKQKCKAIIFWLYLAGVDNKTINDLSTMTYTGENMFDMDCIKV